jgi:hypothetical protein
MSARKRTRPALGPSPVIAGRDGTTHSPMPGPRAFQWGPMPILKVLSRLLVHPKRETASPLAEIELPSPTLGALQAEEAELPECSSPPCYLDERMLQ